MDARELLRRYLEQRRELGESELVLDTLRVEEVMRLLGAAGRPSSTRSPKRSVREIVAEQSQDWRSSLREAGVNVDAPAPAAAALIDAAIEPSPAEAKPPNDMAFKKGIVIAPTETELIPSAIEQLDSLEEIAAT